MKKKLSVHALFSFVFLLSNAQLLPVKNTFQTDIAKIISDYPNHFKSLAGEHVKDNTQTAEYSCTISVKDALECKVVKFSATTKEIYSWEAIMLRTDDFEEAAKKFKTLYNSLQHLSADINGSRAVFNGEYVKPSESIKFTSVVFDTEDKSPELKRLKLGLVLEAEMIEWVVKIQVYEKEREDNERGTIKE
jgi:uncharacterized membrane protein YgaE (UPF0421/DUF939 family)